MADGVKMGRVWWMVGRRLTAVMLIGALATLTVRLVDSGPVEALVRGGDRSAMTDEERLAVIDTARSSTVAVAALTCWGNVSGSGFLLDEMVVTNRHVVGDADQIAATGSAGQQELPVLGHFGDGVDIALSGPAVGPSLDLADHDPEIGEPIILSAYRSGRRHVVLEASVHAYADGASYGIEGPVMLVDVETASGFSGGPVLNRDAEVVGVMQAYDATTGLSLVIPGSSMNGQENTITATRVERC